MSNPAAPATGRLAQIRQPYQMTMPTQPRVGLLLVAVFALTAAVVATLDVLLFRTGRIWIFLTVQLPIPNSLLTSLLW